MLNGPNTAEICMIKLSSYFLITIIEIELENASPGDIWNLRIVLLTHWKLMASILFGIAILYSNQFKCNYLRKKKRFLNFFHHFLNFYQSFNILNKKMTLMDHVFPKLETVEDVLGLMSKK